MAKKRYLYRLVSVSQIAARLNVCEETIRRLSRDGKLPAYKVGRSWRYDPVEIATYFANS